MRKRATSIVLLSGLLALVAVGAVGTATPVAAAPAGALREVTSFGPNPGALRMFEYVPPTVSRHPAVVVVLHYCTGSGPVMFTNTQYASLADQFGFVAIYPSVTRSFDCFDVSSPQSLTHNGGSDPVSIVSMVKYVERTSHADRSRVFATGLSSGAMMTNVLLGAYPDVFRAGSAYAGVPFACFATTDGSQWNSACANGQISKTPQQWGDLVRAAFPGYHGPRPRMQLWHGTADTALFYPNFGEEIKQWTNVHRLSQTATATDHPQPTWTRTSYAARSGAVAVEAISEQDVTHNIPIQAAATIHFFGLDRRRGGDFDAASHAGTSGGVTASLRSQSRPGGGDLPIERPQRGPLPSSGGSPASSALVDLPLASDSVMER
jgi:acetylxylan esterase